MPEINALHERLRIWTLLTIDGAQYFYDDDPRWEIYMLYGAKHNDYSLPRR